MATNVNPVGVKAKVLALRTEFGELRSQVQIAETRGRQIDDEIRQIQSQCPHQSASERPVLDVAEIKDRKFCDECGAQCP